MARKVDKAADFVFVQLQTPPDYAGQDKIDLAWERISHETKESGSRLSSSKQYKRVRLNCHRGTDAPNIFFT
jgi:predicted DCC family thiol-disulfide oxidoreductase YuxK